MKYSREDVKNKLKKYNIICSYTKNSTVGITVNNRIPNNTLIKIKSDMFEVQDEGSQLMTLLIGVQDKYENFRYVCWKRNKNYINE